MITHHDFRRIALALDGVVEGAHMGHPDFRVNGRVFASLRASLDAGAIKLTPEQQADVLRGEGGFEPEAGAWGRQGWTRVQLAAVDGERVGEALTLAWQNTVAAPRPRPRRRR